MYILELPMHEIVAALTTWVIAALFICLINLPLRSVLKGMVVAVLVLTPTLPLVYPQGMMLVAQITVTTIVLGAGLGFIIGKITGNKPVFVSE